MKEDTMKLKIVTEVENTGEVRLLVEDDVNKDEVVFILAETMDDAVLNYSSEDRDWYNNDIVTTATFKNIKIIAKVGYSFSSQFLNMTLKIEGKEIVTVSFENNQIEQEWDINTSASSFIYENEEHLLKDIKI